MTGQDTMDVDGATEADITTPGSNNDRLRALVEGAGLSHAVALTLFNRGLGQAAFLDSAWRALFASPSSTQFIPITDELLAHAEKAFGPLQIKK